MPDEERTPKASANEMNEFMDSFVWEDMQYEINLWLGGARDGLEDPDADEKEIYRNQGRADACRRFLAVPEVLRDSLLVDQEIAKGSRNGDFRGDIIQSTPNKEELE